MVVVAAGREKGGLVADPLREVEAEDVAVEGKRAVDVRDLQVDVPDVDARIDAHEPTIPLAALTASSSAVKMAA